jgi:hypothetical protein
LNLFSFPHFYVSRLERQWEQQDTLRDTPLVDYFIILGVAVAQAAVDTATFCRESQIHLAGTHLHHSRMELLHSRAGRCYNYEQIFFTLSPRSFFSLHKSVHFDDHNKDQNNMFNPRGARDICVLNPSCLPHTTCTQHDN